ncbi:MAG: hypothetical protein PHI49_13490 [Halothiobacillaceae bacterium]|nr:hypothetical protein [Halothiobacillaceae bacterium]
MDAKGVLPLDGASLSARPRGALQFIERVQHGAVVDVDVDVDVERDQDDLQSPCER